MLLNQLIDREIVVGKTPRATMQGVGISLKTYQIKYFLCVGVNSPHASFAISATAITSFGESILLPRLRPVIPKYCACIFPRLPVYAFDGEYLGNVEDLAIENLTATTLFTDKGISIPTSAIAACSDALLLKKEQPYPLGQRIPAPFLPLITDKTDKVITKPVLRNAIENSSLIKLTLSLPPFYFDGLG